MKWFKLTKKWQNHVWKERYNCVNKLIEVEREEKKFKAKRTNSSKERAWLIRDDHKFDNETETETVTDVESDVESYNEVDEVNRDERKDPHVKFDQENCNTNGGGHPRSKLCDFEEFKIVSQNVKGLKDDSKLEGIIDAMLTSNTDAFLLQETWLVGNKTHVIRGFTVLLHGLDNAISRRGERGVGIILSPRFSRFYERAGGLPPVVSSQDGHDVCGGRYMEIALKLKGTFRCKKGAFRKRKIMKKEISVRLISTYTSGEEDEQVYLQDFMSNRLKSFPKSTSVMIGQDSNAQIGKEEAIDDGELNDACIGKYALKKTDDKGRQLLDFIRNNDLKIANTFFRAKEYNTFKSFNRTGSLHQIDHVFVTKDLMEYIDGCSVDNVVATSSDHSAIKTIIRLRAPKKAQKLRKKADWHKLMKEEVKEAFNVELNNIVDNCVDLSYEEFNNYIKDAANKVVREEVDDNRGWFEFSSDLLRPLIDRRNSLLARARVIHGCDEDLKQQCRDAKNDLKDAIAVAKGRWIEHLVSKISQIKLNPKEAWDNIKLLSNGFVGHHVVKKSLKFRNKDGSIATSDRENAILAGEHFTKVFNRDASVDWDHINKTTQKEILNCLADTLTFGEFNLAIEKLSWHKSPGKNGVSPNMIKALDVENRRILFRFMRDWMENDDLTFDEWLESRLVPLPKKGDLHDLNNWRGINLIDVCSKVMSIVLNIRAQKLVKVNGHPMQFGATPKVGCAEAVFSLKSILQARREMGEDTYAIFIDLVKAYDSVRHDVISFALRKLGAPEKYIRWIEKLHRDFGVTLKVGREEIYIKYGCGVRQGDNLAPTLFIIVMQLVAEDIIRQLKIENVVIPIVRYDNKGGGVLRAHKPREINVMDRLEVNTFTYVDDGAMLFESRSDTELASPIVCKIMAKWGLTAHVGYDGKQSKTELMYFPSTVTIARWRKESLVLEDDSGNLFSNSVEVITKKVVDLRIKYSEAPETRDITVDERGGTLSFTMEFLYLGSNIDFLIDDTTDVKNRISKASKSMGALKFIWDAVEVPLSTKIKLYQTIPMNLMLWGSENWSGNKADIKLLDTFHHKSIRRILGISMG